MISFPKILGQGLSLVYVLIDYNQYKTFDARFESIYTSWHICLVQNYIAVNSKEKVKN